LVGWLASRKLTFLEPIGSAMEKLVGLTVTPAVSLSVTEAVISLTTSPW
jgi:hypothetical protein